MRQTPANGKHNAAGRRMHTAFDDRAMRHGRDVNRRQADRQTSRKPLRTLVRFLARPIMARGGRRRAYAIEAH